MDNQDNFENPVNQDNQNTEVPPPISVKKENSYTYWVKNDPNHPKIDCQPKKVEDPNLIPQQQNTVHSAWNASGTWEERKLNLNDIKEALGQLQGLEIGTAKIAKTTSVSGEATYYFIRGKKRLGYHLKIEFELEEGGTIKYTDFTDDGDREFELDDVQNPTVKASIETLNSATLKVIEQFK